MVRVEKEVVAVPPVVAVPLLDTAFRSEALGEEKLIARANDGRLGHFY